MRKAILFPSLTSPYYYDSMVIFYHYNSCSAIISTHFLYNLKFYKGIFCHIAKR
jgi:hypothetical protein